MLRVQWSRDRSRHATPKGQSCSRYSAAMGQIPRSTERISSILSHTCEPPHRRFAEPVYLFITPWSQLHWL